METNNTTRINEQEKNRLFATLWNVANTLRGAMTADNFRDYMLSLLFMRYLSENYETEARKILGSDLPEGDNALKAWCDMNPDDVKDFEAEIQRSLHYIIKPEYLWNNIYELARTQSSDLLSTLEEAFKYIENESFESSLQGLFSEINLNSEKLGKDYAHRNASLCNIISTLESSLVSFSKDYDILGDAYEYLIGEFAANAGQKAGEFYTPQQISTILSRLVILDTQDPTTGTKKQLGSILDFACGSGSLLLNVKHQMEDAGGKIGKIYGQEKNITTYNLARMNMLLHGVKDSAFSIFHGDTLANDWPMLTAEDPSKQMRFDAVVANPPFSLKWTPKEEDAQDPRFANYGVAPKSAADFAFLLHGLNYLADNGTMAIILPHGVLFRGGSEEKIRTKLLKDNNIDCVIGLPSNLFFSTGIPVCIIVLKKCRKNDDVLFINAAELFEKGKKQNKLTPEHIEKIVKAYQYRTEEPRFSRRVSLQEIEDNDYNLNITRYVSLAKEEEPVSLEEVHSRLSDIEARCTTAKARHNTFLKELGLPEIK